MTQKFEHCRMEGTTITYLGRNRVFENRRDESWSESAAWDFLEKEGWELVSVIIGKNDHQIAYFKRVFSEK